MVRFRIDEFIAKSRRLGRKVTQEQLAQAAGIQQASVSQIIRNETKSPNPEILLAFADVFSEALGRTIRIDDLLERRREARIGRTPDGTSESLPVLQVEPPLRDLVSLKEITTRDNWLVPEEGPDEAVNTHYTTRGGPSSEGLQGEIASEQNNVYSNDNVFIVPLAIHVAETIEHLSLSIVPVLIRALDQSDESERLEILKAFYRMREGIGKMAEQARSAAPKLRELLMDSNEEVRKTVALILESIE